MVGSRRTRPVVRARRPAADARRSVAWRCIWAASLRASRPDVGALREPYPRPVAMRCIER